MIPKQSMKLSHFSSINYYKQVLNSTIIKDLGVVYKDISTDTTQYDSCEKAIYFL